MAEQFLTLMADLDEESQKLMSGWYDRLKEAGFIGQQTPNLPFHISLASFALDKEQEAVAETKRLAEEFAPVKNRTGVDSVESARELLKKNGVTL